MDVLSRELLCLNMQGINFLQNAGEKD